VSIAAFFTACDYAGPEEEAAAATAATESECRDGGEARDRTPEVMTRNLYLGADLTPALTAASPLEFAVAATAIWGKVVANDFHARAELLADEIARSRPELVGLQEAFLWRTQEPGDAAAGGTTPATTVAYDYLADLLAALEARGLEYQVAKEIELVDVEAPTLLGIDVRATDRQAILARAGVDVANPRGAIYSIVLPVPVLGSTLLVKRGWTAVDARIGGEWVTFANTHLESYNAAVRVAQGTELAAILSATPGKAVLVGDLNSLPGTEGAALVAGAGFTDVWAALHPRRDGFTCCWPEELANTEPGLDQRIDYVMVRDVRPLTARIVGEAPRDHRSGLWPSDHAGVVASLRPRKHGREE
jgi:endonuclease/exonuclease/phosphatase family metal-dependent hydrolase